MKVSEKAYTAGIIDGEGSISAYYAGYDGNLTMRVTVVQRQDRVEMLQFLKDRWGGSIQNHDKSNGRNNTSAWVLLAMNAKKMLLKIHPFLILKKRQAELAVAFQVMRNAVTAYRSTLGSRRGSQFEDVLTATDLTKEMFTAFNSKHPNITPVAETEREDLINLLHYLTDKYSSMYKDATVQSMQIVNA